MSAINTLASQNVIILTRTRCAHAHVCVPEVVQRVPVPRVRAKWRVEAEPDGSRRLVRHWFKEETSVQSSGRSRSSH